LDRQTSDHRSSSFEKINPGSRRAVSRLPGTHTHPDCSTWNTAKAIASLIFLYSRWAFALATYPTPLAMAKSLEVSPMKSLAEELDFLRKLFRETVQAYSTRVETQLNQVRDSVLEQAKNQNLPPAQIRDLRDMITLCRTLDLKPEKGRRKDLKKIDTLVEELHLMVQNWQ
jgi:uncharacterized protein YfkK (UPF0435 family)